MAPPKLRVIRGGDDWESSFEPITSRDAAIRCLVEAGADLLLRRITVELAERVEKAVDTVIALEDRPATNDPVWISARATAYNTLRLAMRTARVEKRRKAETRRRF